MTFFTGATGCYPGGVLLWIRAATDQGPGSSFQCSYWVVAARRPRTTITDCQDGGANRAGPLKCTASMTPASVRIRDKRTDARQTTPILPLTTSSGLSSDEGGTGTRSRVRRTPAVACSFLFKNLNSLTNLAMFLGAHLLRQASSVKHNLSISCTKINVSPCLSNLLTKSWLS